MHGGTVGHGRGRPGSGRVPVGGRPARVPGLRGRCARGDGRGPWGAWGRHAAAAAGAVRGVSGHARVVAGDGVAAAGLRRRGDRRGVAARAGGLVTAGSGRAGCAGGDGAGLAAAVGRPVWSRPASFGEVAGRGVTAVPNAFGCPWRDVLAALGAATAAVTGRFGAVGVIGAVTVWQVAAACSAGRLLAPGWPGVA